MVVIQGHAVDPHGQPVTEAAVYVVSSPASMPDIALLTDGRGRFTISAPVPGLYVLGVRSEDWGTVQVEVDVKGEEAAAVEVQFNAREDRP